MTRPFWLRTLLSLWALWFGVAITEPAGLTSCPAHGVAGATMNHGGHAHQNGSRPNQHADCTCLGACCACTTATRPTASTDEIIEPAVVRAQATAPCLELPRAESAEYLHPFASGPPGVA